MIRFPNLIAALGAALALGACAPSTKLTSSWKDPDQAARPVHKVVVIAMAQDPEVRKFAENQGVRGFPSGVKAVAGYQLFPKLDTDPEVVKAKLKAEGFDAALVSRVVAVDKSETYVPPTAYTVPAAPVYSPITYGGPVPYRSFYGYYGYAAQQVVTPGYVREETTVLVETLLYDVATGKPVWSGVSETFDSGSTRETVDGILGVVFRELRAQGFIAK